MKPTYFEDIRDGKSYKIVKLSDGNWWFSENLNFSTSGSLEVTFSDHNAFIREQYSEAEYPDLYNLPYGRLYTWTDSMKYCPPGSELPSKKDCLKIINDSDVTKLNFLPGVLVSGKIKAGMYLQYFEHGSCKFWTKSKPFRIFTGPATAFTFPGEDTEHLSWGLPVRCIVRS